MDKTIETKFFEAFKWGGVVNKCIDWMRYTYKLPPMKSTEKENERQQDEREEAANETWERYYKEVLPKEILEATAAFDYGMVYNNDSPLMNEIEANLNECQTDAQRERYLYSLLKPFGREPNGCGIARVFTPIAEVNQLNEQIGKYEKNKADWQTMPQDGQSIEQIGTCDKVIKRLKEQIEWELHVNTRFCDFICGGGKTAKCMQENTVEHCLHTFVNVKRIFANRLDALLLTYGINLMKLQKESGLYLKEQRLATDVMNYIGSKELAQKYINALPKEPQQEQATQEPKQEHSQQQVSHKSNRSKGRPKETLKDKMINDAEGSKLQRLHEIMRGKKGKDAALIILACVKEGWMHKPTFKQVQEEFGDIGNQSGYNKYMREGPFTDMEIEAIIKNLNE